MRSNDGHRLGRILAIQGEELIVEKGMLWWRRDFAVNLSDVRDVGHGEVVLNHGLDSLFAAPRAVPHPPPARRKPPVTHLPAHQKG